MVELRRWWVVSRAARLGVVVRFGGGERAGHVGRGIDISAACGRIKD